MFSDVIMANDNIQFFRLRSYLQKKTLLLKCFCICKNLLKSKVHLHFVSGKFEACTPGACTIQHFELLF